MARQLIINADDFGTSFENVQLLTECFETRRVSSLSAFAAMPGAPFLGKLDAPVGLHFTFTCGLSCREPWEIPSLIKPKTLAFFDEKPFHPATLARIVPGELERELTAQFQRLREHGIEPTHIDNHRHEIYLIPDLFNVVIDFAAAAAVPIRMPFDDHLSKKAPAYAAAYGVPQDLVLSLGMQYRARCRKKGVRHPHHYFQLEHMRLSQDGFRQLIHSLPQGVTELCVHPDQNPAELELLEALPDLVRGTDIELVSFADAF